VGPWRGEAAAGLIVGKLNGRQLAGALEVPRAVRDEPRLGGRGADGGVPLLPQLDQPRPAPFEVGAADGIARVGGLGQILAGGLVEVLLAVDAVAITALRRPAVGKDAIDFVLRDDLLMDAIHEVEVVRPERAADPEGLVRPVA